MLHTLVGLDRAVRDLRLYVEQQQQQQGSSLSLATVTVTPAAAPALVARLLNGVEEAFTPDPLCDAAAFFESVVVPLLQRAPRLHKTHFPLEETLRERRPDAPDAFRCWLVEGLNTVDSLREAALLLLVGRRPAGDGGGGDNVLFRKEQVRRLRQCLGPRTYLLRAAYITPLLSLLYEVWHPRVHTRAGTRRVAVQYRLLLAEALPLFRDAPREVHLERLRLHRKRRKKQQQPTTSEAARTPTNSSVVKDGLAGMKLAPPMGSLSVPVDDGAPSEAPLWWSRVKEMVCPLTDKDGEADYRHRQNHNDNNEKINIDDDDDYYYGEYCYVTDASTQTAGSGVDRRDWEQRRDGADGVVAAACFNGNVTDCIGGSSRSSNKNAACRSIGTNTLQPSPLMTTMELLDAQEQLEATRAALRRDGESLQLRERHLAELEAEYKEKLSMLTDVLHGAKKLYNELVMHPGGRGAGAEASQQQQPPHLAEVEARLLNLIEVIYGKDGEGGRAAVPVPDTPVTRAKAQQTILQYDERRRKHLQQERPRTTTAAPVNAVASFVGAASVGPLVFPPVELPRAVQLQQQAYRCPGCGVSLDGSGQGLFRFGKPRRCHYCTQIYCHACHTNRTSVLPFLVLTTWDFTTRYVCDRDHAWLQQNWNKPWCTMGDRAGQLEQHHLHPVSLRGSVQLAKVLRHWFLVCSQMVRCCSEPLAADVAAPLQTYYADTDVMYSLSDMCGIQYSEESGIAARELRSGRGWVLSTVGIAGRGRSSSSSLLHDAALIATTVGNVVSAMPYPAALERLWAAMSAEKNGGTPTVLGPATGTAAGVDEKRVDRPKPLPSSATFGQSTRTSSASAESGAGSMPPSSSTRGAAGGGGGGGADGRQDFLRYLVTQIQAMERHLLRDCSFCVARATTVCELCGERDDQTRLLPLMDAEVVGVRLLEAAAAAAASASAVRETPLIEAARVAVQLVRGSGGGVAACGNCGTRYHRECLIKTRCPHCV